MNEEVLVTLLTVAVVVTFAMMVTFHVATVYGLLRKRRVRAALAALVVPPLAPWLARRWGMRGRAIGWLMTAPLYVVALVLAGTRVVPLGT